MSHSEVYLESSEAPWEKRARSRRRTVGLLVSAALIFLVILAVAVLLALGQVAAASLDGKAALLRAKSAALTLDFETAHDELLAADHSFTSADRGFLLLNLFRFVPWVGTQIQAADVLLTSGKSVVGALVDVVDLGAELTRLSGFNREEIQSILQGLEPAVTFEHLPAATKRAILQRLSASSDDFALMETKIRIAQQELAGLPRDELVGPLLTAMEPLTANLDELSANLRLLAIAARLLPELAGLGEERVSLLLFLNNNELRPGGGFIGTYGLLAMRDGDIVRVLTKDVYNLDWPAAPFVTRAPPEPMAKYLGIAQWFFRDANWSPDFAVSSRQTLELFRDEIQALPAAVRASVQAPVTVNNVIGFTPTFAAALLTITGPIKIGAQTFTAGNVADLLEYQVEFGYAKQGIPVTQRKEIIADLVLEMKTRLFSLPLARWSELAAASEEALRAKQFVLYSESQPVQDVITKVGWGGRVAPAPGDAQLYVDANLASLKTDAAISRSLKYEIIKNAAGEYLGRTTMTYRHNGRFDYQTTRYRTYARLYVPLGSTWLRTSGALQNDKLKNPSGQPGTVDIGEDLGFTTFGAFTSVEPGETRSLVFEYKLSAGTVSAIKAGRYRLDYLKQVGAANYPLTLELDFDKNVTAATPGEESKDWGDDRYRLNTILDQDRTFQVSL